ncbi:MAG: hypothetical protein RMK19_02875 [Bacteroidia bacterium]|nr:hypothetical protein [Bacteroidia bacterium]
MPILADYNLFLPLLLHVGFKVFLLLYVLNPSFWQLGTIEEGQIIGQRVIL